MRRFQLQRDQDVSGVSGTGVVALGVVFPDGIAAMHWLGPLNSTVIYHDVEHVQQIHGHGGATRVVWIDPVGSMDLGKSLLMAAADAAHLAEDLHVLSEFADQPSGDDDRLG